MVTLVLWSEFDARFPEPAPIDREAPRAYGTWLRTHVDALVTREARRALGLSAKPIERDELYAVISAAVGTDFVMRDPGTPAMLALVAAIEKDWDGVAACTGRRPLGSRVVNAKTFGTDATALARHLATAARSQLPAKQVIAAMREMREQVAAKTIVDVRVGVLAARLFVGDIVAAPDVVAATRAWLAGEEIEIVDSAAPVKAVADGEDPRIKIFERYAGELGDDALIDRELALLETTDHEPWHRYLEKERAPIEDAVIRAWMARRRVPQGWEALVDPIVAGWLGSESQAQLSLDDRVSDLKAYGIRVRVGREWLDPVRGLAVGKIYPGTVVGAFKPGKFFKDDGPKLLEYLAHAVVIEARPEAVEPAWLDFLSRRSPATTVRIGEEQLRWKHLLSIQCAITHRLGKQPLEQVGAALQRIVTGV